MSILKPWACVWVWDLHNMFFLTCRQHRFHFRSIAAKLKNIAYITLYEYVADFSQIRVFCSFTEAELFIYCIVYSIFKDAFS